MKKKYVLFSYHFEFKKKTFEIGSLLCVAREGTMPWCHLSVSFATTMKGNNIPSWLRDKINHLIFAVHLRPLHSKKLVIRATEFQTGDDRI